MPSPLTLHPIYPPKRLRDNWDAWRKASSWVATADYLTINAAMGGPGAIAFIIDHAIKSTADAIRANNITCADNAAFCNWLRERQYSEFSQRPVGEPAPSPQGQTSHDGRREESARGTAATAADLPTSTGPAVAARSGGGRGGRGRTRGKEARGEE